MDRAYGKLRKQLRALPNNDNTVLWYCSDNGGLRRLGMTGGKAHKGSIYEGGLRVPSILDWPEAIVDPASIQFPCNTSDILPTVMEMVGRSSEIGRPLDGISLLPSIDGQVKVKDRAMAFWQYPRRGVRTPSFVWMPELLAAQATGKMTTDSFRLRLDAGDLSEVFTSDSTQGHAAWLEWPWKLHRIKKKGKEALLNYTIWNWIRWNPKMSFSKRIKELNR